MAATMSKASGQQSHSRFCGRCAFDNAPCVPHHPFYLATIVCPPHWSLWHDGGGGLAWLWLLCCQLKLGHSSVENYQTAAAAVFLVRHRTDRRELIHRRSNFIPKLVSKLTLCSLCSYEFLRTNATELVDGGREQVMRQQGFQLINPTEKWFPGITELRTNFASWDWRFGKTPTFSVERTLQVKYDQQQDKTPSAADNAHPKQHALKLKVDVENGLISGIFLLLGENSGETIPVVSKLKGAEYNEDNFNAIYDSLKSITPDSIMAQAINGS